MAYEFRIPAWMSPVCSSTPEPRAWDVYECELRETRKGTTYVAMVGEPHSLGFADIGSELFNHALQRVDVTDPSSVLGFCSEYGVPTSPIYDGEQRLKLFRACRLSDGKYVSAGRDELVSDHMDMQVLAKIGSRLQALSPADPEVEIDFALPAVQSEESRAEEAASGDAAGAVSLLEVSQAIRLLQTSTVIPVAFRYAAENNWTLEMLCDYLHDARHLSQRGLKYFCYDDDPLFRGHPMDSFEMMRREPWFMEMVMSSAVPDPKPLFDDELARGLCQAAMDAVDFVGLSGLSLSRSLPFPDWGRKPSRDSAANPFKAVRALVAPGFEQSRIASEGSITSAVLYQFSSGFSIASDDAPPYRTCVNCGKVFRKYQQEGPAKSIRATAYCSRNCNYAFNKRGRRKPKE